MINTTLALPSSFIMYFLTFWIIRTILSHLSGQNEQPFLFGVNHYLYLIKMNLCTKMRKFILKRGKVLTNNYRELLILEGLRFSGQNIALSVPYSRNTVFKVLKRLRNKEFHGRWLIPWPTKTRKSNHPHQHHWLLPSWYRLTPAVASRRSRLKSTGRAIPLTNQSWYWRDCAGICFCRRDGIQLV